MSLNLTPRRGSALALALVLAAGLAAPAVTLSAPAAATIAAPTRSPRPESGAGTATVTSGTVLVDATGTPLADVVLSGTGYTAGTDVNVKVDDLYELAALATDASAEGTWTITLKPTDFGDTLAVGEHWFRVLGSTGGAHSHVARFTVATQPATTPTTAPSTEPTTQPSSQPTTAPTAQPSAQPTAQPSTAPTTQPSAQPSTAPGDPSVIDAGQDYTINTRAAVTPVPGTDATAVGTVAGVETQVLRGLYQSAYSAKNGSIYVTSAVGRPPVRNSAIVKLDATTLAYQDHVLPATDPNATDRNGAPVEGSRFAVYGIDVDDTTNTVWVTNTRQNTIAVYDAATLDLVKQFPTGELAHGRDVLIDDTAHLAYITSAQKGNKVAVYDTTTREKVKEIAIPSEGFATMSLAYDAATHTLATVSLATAEAALIDTTTGTATIVPAPATLSSISGVAYDGATGRLYLADQGSGSLTVLTKDGTVVSTTAITSGKTGKDGAPASAGSLSVAYDAADGLVMVANRTAGTVTVHDRDGKLLQTIDSGANTNHVRYAQVNGQGVVYVVNKGGSRDGSSTADYIQRLTLVPAPFTDVPASHPFASDIAWMKATGVTTGYADGTYVPSGTVTRDAMAAFLYRAAGSPAYTAPAVSPFTDVPTTQPFYKEISWLAASGISTGWTVPGGKEFRPAEKITREAMAAFLYRAKGSPAFTAPATSPFTDVKPADPFYKEVTWLASTGVSTGWQTASGRTFGPKSPIARDAMAAFLHRASAL